MFTMVTNPMLVFITTFILIGTIISSCNASAKNADNPSPAEICKNPLVTSATNTPFGVICMIPKSVDSGDDHFSERQLFVRSLPKLLKAEGSGDNQNKIIPSFKSIRNQLLPQSNILSKRSIFSNWVFKFYESFYKGFYNSLKTSSLIHKQNQFQSSKNRVPPDQSQQIPLVMPVANPDQLTPDGQAIPPVITKLPEIQPFPQSDPNLLTNFAQNKENFFANEYHGPHHDYNHHDHHNPTDMNEGSDEMLDNSSEIDETQLGSAQPDLPHYSFGSVRQLATYLQSIQEKINHQKEKNLREEEQTDSSEYVNDYSSYSPNEDKQQFVIPLYTDVKVRQHREHSLSRSEEEVRRPRKLVYEFHGYKRDMDCKGRFKPLKSDTERQQPMSPMAAQGKSRRKRYIEFDYGQMQLRKLPVWFDKIPSSEAIVEVKPRSLFRWEQPMIGWKPIVPPEDLRKDLFLKRNGDPMDSKSDNEQVESEHNYYWLKADVNHTLVTTAEDLKSSESQTIEAIKNLDSSKASIVEDRRKYGRDMNDEDSGYRKAKEQIYDKYLSITDKPNDNQVVPIGEGVKAIEVENVGDEISKVKSLEEIAALPGAVIKPIDSKLTDILLKVLSHNSDFQQKRITNAYFLDFPKLPVYKPEVTQLNPMSNFKTNFLYAEQRYTPLPTPVTDTPVQIETAVDNNYEPAYDRDIQLTDADYEYGEMVCTNKVSGGVADVRKGCRIYFQCTQYTIDTYVCPRGSRFDDTKQFCLPSNKVLCGGYQ